MDASKNIPKLVASTIDTYCGSIAESRIREWQLQNTSAQEKDTNAHAGDTGEEDLEFNYFKSAQWTPDGTSLLTSSADNTIRLFILPPDLLDDRAHALALTPYSKHIHPTSINCIAAYPLYGLSDPTTTLYISAPADLPIRLVNSLSPVPTPAATYSFISPTTEAYYQPSSLLWRMPNTFIAGADCQIALFDVSRNGEGPSVTLPTIPSKRHKMKGGGVGMRGIVSALSMQPSPSSSANESGILAAGTWTRWVGLYDAGGLGGTVATWSIAEAADIHAGISGSGIAQTAWSACGRYLYVAERKSTGVLIFDVRVTGQLLGWLEGREAMTNQRLGIDVFESEKGAEIWSGGTDGVVKVWENVGMTEGGTQCAWDWKGHDDPVSSTVVHSSGTVVGTCSGQRVLLGVDDSSSSDEESSGDEDEDSEISPGNDTQRLNKSVIKPVSRNPDNSVKVWSL